MALRNREEQEAIKLVGVNLADDPSDMELGSFSYLQNWIPYEPTLLPPPPFPAPSDPPNSERFIINAILEVPFPAAFIVNAEFEVPFSSVWFLTNAELEMPDPLIGLITNVELEIPHFGSGITNIEVEVPEPVHALLTSFEFETPFTFSDFTNAEFEVPEPVHALLTNFEFEIPASWSEITNVEFETPTQTRGLLTNFELETPDPLVALFTNAEFEIPSAGSGSFTNFEFQTPDVGFAKFHRMEFQLPDLNKFGLIVEAEMEVPTAAALAVTALGITQQEIDIWNQRRVIGPYRVAGDVQTNSPGDWTRIQNNADLSYSAQRWAGHTASGCWAWNAPSSLPTRQAGQRVRDGAFVYLVTGNTTYRDNVLTELLAQAAQPGTDWTNSTRWNTGSSCMTGDSNSWEISNWLRRLLYAYDYIRHSISTGNRNTLDAWFLAAANLFNANVHNQVSQRFPNRDSDNYTTQSVTSCVSPTLTHFGGFTTCNFHNAWNNRNSNHLMVVAMVGLMQDNTALKNRAKRYFKEWVRFGVFADSTEWEFQRSVGALQPGLGFHYAGVMIGTMVMLADHFARAGDMELYNFSTSLGDNVGLTPAGGPKSLLSITHRYLDYVDISVSRFIRSGANLADRIDSVDEAFNQARNHDTQIVPGNLFWNNARIKSVYLRQASGAPAYPSNPAGWGAGTGHQWMGAWGSLPGVLFMHGQMEDLVNPYPS